MINPFKHTADTVRTWYTEGRENNPGQEDLANMGTTLLMPAIIPIAFVQALFKKK